MYPSAKIILEAVGGIHEVRQPSAAALSAGEWSDRHSNPQLRTNESHASEGCWTFSSPESVEAIRKSSTAPLTRKLCDRMVLPQRDMILLLVKEIESLEASSSLSLFNGSVTAFTFSNVSVHFKLPKLQACAVLGPLKVNSRPVSKTRLRTHPWALTIRSAGPLDQAHI